MRRQRLYEFLETVSPPTAAAALEELLVGARTRDPDAVSIYLALVDLLQEPAWPRNVVDLWRREAWQLGLVEICYPLTHPPDPDVDPDDLGPLHPELQELTLGEKKALARRVREQDFDKFLTETDPRVLDIFLAHPAVQERVVIRLLARRPQHPDVFTTAARHARWLSLPTVQQTIALNPYAPQALSLRLLPLLPANIAAEIAASENLGAGLRAYARSLVRIKDWVE
ncbi:MAG: hypothetical protein D6761_02155 [Candidatus Dadabacteria bacterium]|nr:MAG: hypothetical protein D6761_02155 [Candidatus Dadabacteria bacterium]